MKKLTMFILGMFLLIGLGTAVELADRDAAFIFRDQEVIERDADIDVFISNLVFTTDKVCSLNYDNDEVSCIVCFEFNIPSLNEPFSECIPLEDGASLRDDQARLDDYVKDLVDRNFPREEITYVERVMKDTTRDIPRR